MDPAVLIKMRTIYRGIQIPDKEADVTTGTTGNMKSVPLGVLCQNNELFDERRDALLWDDDNSILWAIVCNPEHIYSDTGKVQMRVFGTDYGDVQCLSTGMNPDILDKFVPLIGATATPTAGQIANIKKKYVTIARDMVSDYVANGNHIY